MFNSDQPLGLPKGSVRAVLAVGVTGVLLGMCLGGIVVPDSLWAIGGIVITFYFTTRGQEKAP